MSARREKQRTFFQEEWHMTWKVKKKKKRRKRLAAVSLRRTHLAKLLINDSKLEVVADHVLVKGDNEPWCLRMREVRVYRVSLGRGGDVVSVEKVITGKVSVKCCCLPSGRGQDKTYPHLLLHKQAGSEKKYNQLFSFFFKHTAKYFWLHILAWYLGHLNHVGELGKAGNGNHIMEGFKLCAERQRNSLKSQNAHCSVSNPKKSPGCFNDFFSIGALHSCKWTVGSKGTFPIDAVCGWVYNDLYIWCVWAKIAWERVKRASLLFQFSESKEKLHAERVLQSEHPRYPLNFMMQQPRVFWKLTF